MSRTESYADKTFIVADGDARLRKANNLIEFERLRLRTAAGGQAGRKFQAHRQGHEGKVDRVKVVPTGSSGAIVFGHCLSTDGTTSSAGRRRETSTASSST